MNITTCKPNEADVKELASFMFQVRRAELDKRNHYEQCKKSRPLCRETTTFEVVHAGFVFREGVVEKPLLNKMRPVKE